MWIAGHLTDASTMANAIPIARFTRIDAFAALVLGNFCRSAGATRYFPYDRIIFYPQIAIKNRLHS
jgi:hypothetical protein